MYLRFAPLALFLMLSTPTGLFAADCEVRFLNRGNADEIDEGFRDKIIPRTGDYQKLVVQTALNAVPPLVCASVGRVVFVYDPSKDAVAFTNSTATINDGRPADLIYFNDSAMPEDRLKPYMMEIGGEQEDAQEINRIAAIHAVIHEAIHVADHLLDSQRVEDSWFGDEPVDASLWSGQAVSLARQAVEKNRLKMGFRQEWERMHNAFVKAGMAREYYGKGGADLKDITKITGEKDADGKPKRAKDRFGREIMIKPAPIELAAAGFMTRYGGTKSSEDIAEMAAGILTRLFVEASAGKSFGRDSYYHAAIEDHACEALRGSPGPGISTQVAAMYSKLGFLQSVGFIPLEGFKRCVGDLAIRGDGAGFHSFKSGDLNRRYSGGVQGAFGRAGPDDPVMFKLTADGSVGTSGGSRPVTVELLLNVSPPPELLDAVTGSYEAVELDDVSFPRGIYYIGTRYKTENRLNIRKKEDEGVIMEVSKGVALVGRANKDLVEGSIFIQRFFNFAGGLMSASAGDEPPKEPTSMTFRKGQDLGSE